MAVSRRARCALALVLAGSSVVACNLISGLSDREVCQGAECPSATPTTTSSGDDRPDATVPPSPPPVPLPEGATPSDWAKWPMRDPNAATYVARVNRNGVDTIVDPVTKLTWQAESGGSADGDNAFAEAKAYCAGLSAVDKWRVPTRIELVSLLDPSDEQTNLQKGVAVFILSSDPYISSTPAPLRPDAGRYEFYTVRFVEELQLNVTSGGSYKVRCVLGDP
jgi:hypothetical protein